MSKNQRKGETAADCLRFEQRPSTPKNVRKYRKSYFEEPGSRVTHPGLVEDAERLREELANTRLGSRSDHASSHVTDLFNGGHTGSLADYVQERKESIYKTVQREPLGKAYVRGHKFDQLREEKMQSNSSESAKDLIYTSEEKSDSIKYHDQYIVSHNAFSPGEQRRRKYNWKGIDPSTHRFGSIEAKRDEGVAYCLQPETFSPAATITNRAVANHRLMTGDQLGKPKYRGNLEPETVARLEQRMEERKRNARSTFSAQDCIEGDYSFAQQLPDPDLGRAIRPGWRNTDTTKVFGAPTVRNDVPPPKMRSVSDSQNYGDDTTAGNLLFPSKFIAEGLDESDVMDPVDKTDVKFFMKRINPDLSDEDFENIYSRACLLAVGVPHDEGNPVVSLNAFLSLMNEREACLDQGHEPVWW